MRELRYRIKGRPVTVHVVEREEELSWFVQWIKRNPEVAFDTETTSLEIYSSGFRVRLAQFGTENEAWVIPVEKGDAYAWHVTCALKYARKLWIHNAGFDIQVAARFLQCDLLDLFRKSIDTGILSRLWDSRAVKDKGPGHKLEELTKALIDPVTAEEVKGSIGRLAKELGISKEEVYATIDIDHDEYNLYAGMDVILTAMLGKMLPGMIPYSARRLVEYEHVISRICTEIEQRGFLLDEEYTKALADRLRQEETWWEMKIEEFVDDDEFNTGSTDDVATVLMDHGWQEFEFTPTGRLKVDDGLLNRAADSGIEFAQWIKEAKKAAKWRKTWPESFLSNMDAHGRCHASIHTMQARTARMSISGIPAQTLPSNDPLVRNCFWADEHELIASVDYAAQELRVTAALSGDEMMLKAFRDGLDLHQITADAAGVGRKVGKMANFLTVYGGGWKALMEQGKVDEATAKKVIYAFNDTYPGVAKMSKALTKQGRQRGYITTPTGRVLHVDRDRAYSAGNYKVQSTSRDITASALIRLDEQGFTPFIRLPIHDEALFSFPAKHAKDLARQAGEIMKHVINGLEVPTDAEVGGRSWGSLYEAK